MFPKVTTKICVEEVGFFRGTAVEVIEKIRAIQDSQPDGVIVEIELDYFGHDGGADIVFNSLREMTDQEKEDFTEKLKEKERKDKIKKDEDRVQKILKKKKNNIKLRENEISFMNKYLKGES